MTQQPRRNKVKKIADALTKIYSMPPIPVHEIAEQNGVEVVFADFGDASDKVSGLCDFQHKKLYVNRKDTLNRQLFTIAHELGHWILHKPIFEKDPDRYPVLPRFTAPNEDDPLEKEANFFAASLLVPKKLLVPIKKLPPAMLAQFFNVSRTMMENRLKNV